MQTTNKSTTNKLLSLICTLVMMFGICGIFGLRGMNASAADTRSITVSQQAKNFDINVPNATNATTSAKFLKAIKNGQGGKFKVFIASMEGVAQMVRKGDIHFKDSSGRDVMILHVKQTRFDLIPSTNLITLKKSAGINNNARFKITSDSTYMLIYDSRYVIKTTDGKEVKNGIIVGANGKKTTKSFIIYPRIANNTGKPITTMIKIKPAADNTVYETIKVVQLTK